ncbi:MAG TPA: hypothetical protein P5081_10545 [Phycisphaerae bacterium]|nr:hypothetical protein [Phycisphaerae bacterium]HRW53316.1 hypothetical protein [Phycisphaerae bacterium]
MYLDELAESIRANIPDDKMPQENAVGLLRIYAALLRAKGAAITQSDIHDGWASWMAERKADHPALIPYSDLDEATRNADQVFARAVRLAAADLDLGAASVAPFSELLFPAGRPNAQREPQQVLLELYKIMVNSSESLVGRRQAVNTFFLTMNGALLTAGGILVQGSGAVELRCLGAAVLAVAGGILCAAWRSLINSFGQLNRGKFKVINALEDYLPAAIYAAEWEALGRGEDPKVYRSFTSREIWVPNSLLLLYVLMAMTAGLIGGGWIPTAH